MKSGVEQLKDWIERRAFSQRDAAEYLGWDEQSFSKLIRGTRGIGLSKAVQIEGLTGIPVEAWVSSLVDKSDSDDSQDMPKPPSRHGSLA